MIRQCDTASQERPCTICAQSHPAALGLDFSEGIPQTELNDPWIVRASDPAEQTRCVIGIRVSEVHAIERVEELGPELRPVVVRKGHRECLEDGEIEICITGSPPGIATQVAERARGVGGESRSVEPLLNPVPARAPVLEIRIPHEIDSVVSDTAERVIKSGNDVERPARLQNCNSVELPVAERITRDAGLGAWELPIE